MLLAPAECFLRVVDAPLGQLGESARFRPVD